MDLSNPTTLLYGFIGFVIFIIFIAVIARTLSVKDMQDSHPVSPMTTSKAGDPTIRDAMVFPQSKQPTNKPKVKIPTGTEITPKKENNPRTIGTWLTIIGAVILFLPTPEWLEVIGFLALGLGWMILRFTDPKKRVR